jgi:preprotein translocase subunit SecG
LKDKAKGTYNVLARQNIFLIAMIIILVFFAIVLISQDSDMQVNTESPIYNGDIDDPSSFPDFRGTRAPDKCADPGCHEGIELINPKMTIECTECHLGNGDAADANAAHNNMYTNPGDFGIVDQTCGKSTICHEEEVVNLKKSLHATSAGIISAARYTWGAQDRKSIFGNYAIEDLDGDVPSYATTSFDQIPTFNDSGEYVDDYLRNQCLRCHVWTEGAKRDGDYRSGGCSACHVLYYDEGGYQGADPTINKSEPDHMIKHEITTKIPAEQCIHCHNRGGRTEVSYIGTMESDGYGTPFQEGGGKAGKLHGKNYNHLSPDVHYERGMQCIDCHTQREIMGDGNIYGKKEEAVEIECVDCHGTPDEYPWDENEKVTTSGAIKSDGTPYGITGGNEFTNIEKIGDTLVLTSKYDDETHDIPLLKEKKDAASWKSNDAKVAMSAIPHIDKLECYACHASWAPQCYGCHPKMDARSSGYDWIAGDNNASGWSESRSYLRWETPVLGINAEGNVAPFIPGCQVVFTFINETGETVILNMIYTTVDGTSGIAQNPIQPHTISAKPRTCESCHTSRKTLGLGTGIYNSSANGLDIDFELERIVDEEGNQIQATSHDGARPFNKTEQEKISRVGLCIGCHESYDDPIWSNITDEVGLARTPESHESIMSFALTSIPGENPIIVFLAVDGGNSNVYLKWNFSQPEELEQYKLYWATSEITNLTGLTPNATTSDTEYTVSSLTANTTYHFVIASEDANGNQTGIAFSSAIPTRPAEVEPPDDTDGKKTETKENETYLWTTILLAILLIILIIIMRLRGGKSETVRTNEEEIKEETVIEEPLEDKEVDESAEIKEDESRD